MNRKLCAILGFLFAALAIATAWLGSYLSTRWTGACIAQFIFFVLAAFVSFAFTLDGDLYDD